MRLASRRTRLADDRASHADLPAGPGATSTYGNPPRVNAGSTASRDARPPGGPVRPVRAAVVAVALVPALALYLFAFLGQRPVFIDDAFIFFRYASNLAGGHGLVYNLGEHVEGYSSLLWTLILSAAALLPVPLERVAALLGLACALASLVMLGALCARIFARAPLLVAVIPAALALSTGFVFYSASGMDTLPFMAILLGVVLAALAALEGGSALPLGVGLVLLVAVRAEGPLYALAALAALALARRGLDARLALRPLVACVLVTAAAIGLQAGWRLAVYHQWVPATVMAKSYTTHLLGECSLADPASVRRFLWALWRGARYEALLVGPAAILVLAILLRRTRFAVDRPAVAVIGPLVLLNAFVALWALGDWMPFHRHLVPLWPMVLVLTALALTDALPARVVARVPHLAAAVVSLPLLVLGMASCERAPDVSHPALRVFRAERNDSLMRELGSALRSGGGRVVVATNIAGAVAYYAGPEVYVRDVLGLTDAYNARYGAHWVATYGRSDLVHSFGPPLDVLVSNTASDVVRLMENAGAPDGGPPHYGIYLSRAWLRAGYFIVADMRRPVARALARVAGSEPQPLTLEAAKMLARR